MKTQSKEAFFMHILVVEDERALCETIVRSLRRLAYSVDFCHDGNEAIGLLAVEQYDLVLLDLNLPGADGMTVLQTLRQTDRDTRVLILSARSTVIKGMRHCRDSFFMFCSPPLHSPRRCGCESDHIREQRAVFCAELKYAPVSSC